MNLSSLNVDVLLYLIKFVDPEDRFNLVLSGILKGFENANERIDLRQRIEGFRIELAECRDGTCQLEIRSLEDRWSCYKLKDESRLITLEQLAAGGFFKNNRQMIVHSRWPSISPLCQVTSSMADLKKLSLLNWKLRLALDVAQLFRSCPKLTELHLELGEWQGFKMNEETKHEVRSGFQRIRLLELHWDIYAWPVILELFTWLKDCAQLTMNYLGCRKPVIDGSMILDPDLTQNLRDLRLRDFPVEFIEWILPFCSNIHTLKIHLIVELKESHNEIARLKKLKNLYISTVDPKEIFRNCRQVEVLRVEAYNINLRDLAALKHYGNLKEAHLRWFHDISVKEALPILKRCTTMHRLTLKKWILDTVFPPSKEFCEFIMEMKHLTFLHIIYDDIPNCDHFESLVVQVKAFVLPRRPNFKFYVSCCEKFPESRVPGEFDFYRT